MKYNLRKTISVLLTAAVLCTAGATAAADSAVSEFDYHGEQSPASIQLCNGQTTVSVDAECSWYGHVDRADAAGNIARNLFDNHCDYLPDVSETAQYEFAVNDPSVFAFRKYDDVVVKGNEAEFAVIAFGVEDGDSVAVAVYPKDNEDKMKVDSVEIEDNTGSYTISAKTTSHYRPGYYTFLAVGNDFSYTFDFLVVEPSEAPTAGTDSGSATYGNQPGTGTGSNPDETSGDEHGLNITNPQGDAITVGYSPSTGAFSGSVTKDDSTVNGSYNRSSGEITVGTQQQAVTVNVNSGTVSSAAPSASETMSPGINTEYNGIGMNIPIFGR